MADIEIFRRLRKRLKRSKTTAETPRDRFQKDELQKDGSFNRGRSLRKAMKFSSLRKAFTRANPKEKILVSPSLGSTVMMAKLSIKEDNSTSRPPPPSLLQIGRGEENIGYPRVYSPTLGEFEGVRILPLSEMLPDQRPDKSGPRNRKSTLEPQPLSHDFEDAIDEVYDDSGEQYDAEMLLRRQQVADAKQFLQERSHPSKLKTQSQLVRGRSLRDEYLASGTTAPPHRTYSSSKTDIDRTSKSPHGSAH